MLCTLVELTWVEAEGLGRITDIGGIGLHVLEHVEVLRGVQDIVYYESGVDSFSSVRRKCRLAPAFFYV